LLFSFGGAFVLRRGFSGQLVGTMALRLSRFSVLVPACAPCDSFFCEVESFPTCTGLLRGTLEWAGRMGGVSGRWGLSARFHGTSWSCSYSRGFSFRTPFFPPHLLVSWGGELMYPPTLGSLLASGSMGWKIRRL